MSATADVARRLVELWNSHDPTGLARVFTPTATFRDTAFAVERRGLEELRELFVSTWNGLPDLRIEILHAICGDERAALEWRLTGTHDGDFPDLPATGRTVRIEGVSVIRVEDGRIAVQRDYYDRAAFLEQLGSGEAGSS